VKKRYNDTSGVILAGGKNSRMGLHKAFIKLNSKRFIDFTLDIMRELFEEIIIVTNNKEDFSEFKDLLVTEDLIEGKGPLGGIYTGLEATSKEQSFFMACDMPFTHIEFIKRQIECFHRNRDCDALVPRLGDKIEPLAAIYKRNLRDKMRYFLEKDRDYSVKRFLRTVRVLYYDIEDNSVNKNIFKNINTPEELNEIRRIVCE